ncbi:MAG: type IV pilus biogenesis/stability protein PilW [Gammaproteobacteria bacterium]|nr:type IV pilus biogenesis/stability protein PilW [Gammaproteobacteria bacterium]
MNSRLAIAVVLAATLAACASREEQAASEVRSSRLVETRTQLAASYMQRNQLDIALEELEKALAVESDNSQANNVMGLLQIRLKNDEKAEQHFRRALSAQGDNSEARNNYGVFLCERGRLDDAEHQFKTALANPLYKTPEIAGINAGTCLLKKNAPALAEKYFRTALQVNPKSPTALYQMAVLNFTAKQFLPARGFIQRYMEVGNDTPESLLLAIRIEHALGAKDAQAQYAGRLRSKFPDSPEAKQLSDWSGG